MLFDKAKRSVAACIINALLTITFIVVTSIAVPGIAVPKAFAEITPYLQTPSENSIWVTWKTAGDSSSRIEYGLTEDQLNLVQEGSRQSLAANYFYHSVQLQNLQANTLYYYRVISGSDSSAVYRFKTQPMPGEGSGHYRILVMGDHQIRAEDRYFKLVNAAKGKLESLFGSSVEQSVNLILNDGDQVDVGTLDHYENLHFAQSAPLSPNLPIMTTVGNHEYYSDGDLSNYQAHFIYDGTSYKGIAPAADESYYAYQLGRILFVHLNSMRTDAQQEAWLRKVMTAVENDESVDWLISIIHHPYQAEQYVGDISNTFRNSWMKIMSASPKHVLNIGGHHHLYARGQTRDWPTYHMISGGTAWDQYWGQSTEIDFDDVQKTIANWSWQIIDIDLTAGSMKVDSYAEAHPIIYKNNGQKMHYDSRLIDSFERKLAVQLPDKPQIQNKPESTITLPYSFVSSAYSTSGPELLNSTQFQIASDAEFKQLEIDKIRDYENTYGDSGAPLYEPIDIHKNLDILTWQIPAYGLTNGQHYIRVRHRDRNLQWSPWSDSLTFSVEGSTDGPPELNIDKAKYRSGEIVVAQYSNGYGNAEDWIGIYKKGQTPGDALATQWSYVSGTNGQINFSDLADGEYYITFLEDGGYNEIAPRVYFYLGVVADLEIDKAEYNLGENVQLSYQNAPAGAKDWIGIYRMGHTPGQESSTLWSYTPNSSAQVNFTGLAKGYYFAAFFINDGYTEISERVYFSVGEEIVQILLDKRQFTQGEPINVSFSNGRGGLKDYIGVFQNIPGQIPNGDNLLAYAYFDGAVSGSVSITSTFTGENLPVGQYWVGMYQNDGYDRISNAICIVITGLGQDQSQCAAQPVLASSKSSFDINESLSFTWQDSSGNAKDWLAVYPADQAPGEQPSIAWQYLDGSSGTADFEPLPAGEYYLVILLNDGYEEASSRYYFSVQQNQASIGSETTRFFLGEAVDLNWANSPGNPKDWIGIYPAGVNPGEVNSLLWSYLDASSGSASFSGLELGEYYAALLLDDGYEEAAPRFEFSVVEAPSLSLSTTEFKVDELVEIHWANTPGGAKDWLGIYFEGDNPGDVYSVQWQYLQSSNGLVQFEGLAPGEYYAVVLLNDGYEEATDRVSFKIVEAAQLGDLNENGQLDIQDRNALRASLGQCLGDAGFVAAADLDHNQCVDNRDYRLWLQLYRQQSI